MDANAIVDLLQNIGLLILTGWVCYLIIVKEDKA